VAREAAGTAARGVAMRAAAVARAQGGGPAEAMAAGREAILPVARELQDAAFGLLDALIAGSPPPPPPPPGSTDEVPVAPEQLTPG
jgi:hypothetical protein